MIDTGIIFQTPGESLKSVPIHSKGQQVCWEPDEVIEKVSIGHIDYWLLGKIPLFYVQFF